MTMSAKAKKTWRFAGINFDHMHMGDLLRMAHEHPSAEIAGICDADPARMEGAMRNFSIPKKHVFTDVGECLAATKPDVVILCPATAQHAEYVERVAPSGAHILVEKPFAASLADADRMIAAVRAPGQRLMINWPLRWYPCHATAHRLLREGAIGYLQEVHYYDGNRGPLRHGADKVETDPGPKAASWWYHRDKGGGSLLDYLGYGVTLGTWFHGGAAPIEVTAIMDEPAGLEVDEHSVTICRYACGLSKFETRWGTFTDPWTHQPQPKCGFVLKGTRGTISSYDYERTIRIQDEDCPEGRDIPVDKIRTPNRNPVEHLIHCLEKGKAIEGPLSPAMARIGQRIVDTAVRSARMKRTLPY